MHTNDVVMASPKVDVNGVEHCKERETPRYTVDDDVFSRGEELVDDSPEKEDVNYRPKLQNKFECAPNEY